MVWILGDFPLQSDVVLIMTCSIREGAETKIWKRLDYLKFLKTSRKHHQRHLPEMKIGILGTFAQRLSPHSCNKVFEFLSCFMAFHSLFQCLIQAAWLRD